MVTLNHGVNCLELGVGEQFFVNAKVRILARGTLVAKKLMEALRLV